MSPSVRLSLELVEDTESPEQNERLYQVWAQSSDGKSDCVEFSAPEDLLVLSAWSSDRQAWVQGAMASALLQEDFLRGELCLKDIQSALSEGRLEWEVLGQGWAPWPSDATLESMAISRPQIASARLDTALPTAEPSRFKPRF